MYVYVVSPLYSTVKTEIFVYFSHTCVILSHCTFHSRSSHRHCDLHLRMNNDREKYCLFSHYITTIEVLCHFIQYHLKYTKIKMRKQIVYNTKSCTSASVHQNITVYQSLTMIPPSCLLRIFRTCFYIKFIIRWKFLGNLNNRY